ncbi:DUF5658 family protein [Dehalobacter sp. DCM]|uniref:DUF5658 family protein n=1 Tax=Dehalobacter sp. DCM TaxID=2907827 RepID=UPI003081CEA4|nr:DUF5658 family protein [Dehalobacter sp. DCM]
MNKLPYILIFLMTIADTLFTAVGMTKGIIAEANPIIKWIFSVNTTLASVTVVMFVGVLLLMIYRFRNHIRWIKYGLGLLVIAKVGVLILHLRWIIEVI